MAHQLVRGLVDPTIQEQVLAHAASNPKLDLPSIQKFIEAKETGRRSGALIAGTGGLNRVSDYKNQKGRERIRSSSQPPSTEKCSWCARPGHGARAPREIREQKCKAFKAKCENCSIIGHFKVACKKKKLPPTSLPHLRHQDRGQDLFIKIHNSGSRFQNLSSRFCKPVIQQWAEDCCQYEGERQDPECEPRLHRAQDSHSHGTN